MFIFDLVDDFHEFAIVLGWNRVVSVTFIGGVSVGGVETSAARVNGEVDVGLVFLEEVANHLGFGL